MKSFFNRHEEDIEEYVEEDDDLDIINLDETAGWSKLEVAEELARQQAANLIEEIGDELAIIDAVEEDTAIEDLGMTAPIAVGTYAASKRAMPKEDLEELQEAELEIEELQDDDIEIEHLQDEDVEYLSDDEEDDEEDEEEYEDASPFVFFENLGAWFSNWTVMDKVVAVTGVLVLAVAILTAGVYAGNRGVDKQIEAFAPVGEQLETIGVVGQDKLLAVADAKKAMLEAAKLEAELNQEYEENELSSEVKVIMKMTTVHKDLKIKFVNKRTGKLVGNIPFEVKIVDADNKTYNKIDEDEDGIIYLTDITPGNYSVSMVELDDLEGYSFSTSTEKIKVKDKIEYEKIDVSDEIKDQSEVDVSKEDTAQKLETEATLTDTVEWVASTKKEASSEDSYTKVSKDTIADPSLSASLNFDFGILRIMPQSMLATVDVNPEPRTGDTTENSIQLDQTSVSMQLKSGETVSVTLNATVVPSDATVTWSSSDPSVASVDGGVVTALKAGTTTITAKAGENEATCSVEVKEEPKDETVAVDSVTINQQAPTVEVGKTITLTATVNPSNATNTKVKWTAGSNGCASVSAEGIVTGVKAGKETITVTTEDGEKTATVEVEVKEAAPTTVAVTGVTLNKVKTTIVVGISETLGATVAPAEATDRSVTWSSDNTAVATVDKNGVVTAVKEGNAKITVTTTDGGFKAVCEVTVTAAGTTITLDKTTASMKTGETLTLKATVSPSDKTVTWKSSDENKAKVDSNGKVEAKAEGEVTITATADGKSATCKITISKAYNPKEDTSKSLKDKSGNQMYILKDGKYIEAKVADYWKYDTFYKKEKVAQYVYTGWQNIDGKTYFFDKNGNKVTGEQVIQGARYNFNSDGSLNTGSGILGIDVSTWNGNIDWNKVKNSGVSYVIIRTGFRGSTQGSLVEDNKFRQNIQGATNAGLKVGVYFFSQAINEVEAVEEASMVLSQVKGYKLTYPVFIDVEPSGGRADKLSSGDRTKVINAFCQTIQNGGLRAGVYANKTWLNQKMNVSALSGYKIWLAQYNSTVTYGGRYDMWQYSDKGSVAGISGKVDMNLSYLSY